MALRPYPGVGPTGGRVDQIQVQTKRTVFYLCRADDLDLMWSEAANGWVTDKDVASRWLQYREADWYRQTRDLGSLTEIIER